MRIVKFEAEAVHGYLDFSIPFNEDITFVTGINGCGKTTVVRCISALMAPSILTLATTEFKKMLLTIQEGDQKINISATRDKAQIRLALDGKQETPVLLLPEDFLPEPMDPRERVSKIYEYYEQQEAALANSEFVLRLRKLPAPMFLGIARRASRGLRLESHVVRPRLFRARRFSRNLFVGNVMADSLDEAAAFAENRYRRTQATQRTLAEQLRKDLILTAFRHKEWPMGPHEVNQIYYELELRKDIIKTTLQELGLTDAEIKASVDPLLERFEELRSKFPSGDKAIAAMTGDDQGEKEAAFGLVMNMPQLSRIREINDLVSTYVRKIQSQNAVIDRYLSIVNKFFDDSKKQLIFDQTGQLCIRRREGATLPLATLSSGESQVVVMITQLVFNPDVQVANVFIVDEPELSLHVKWQELFVEAVISANPKIQLILATHSPAIILDLDEHMVDLTRQ